MSRQHHIRSNSMANRESNSVAIREDSSTLRLKPKIIDFCSIMKKRDSDGKVNLVSDFDSHENLNYLNVNVWESISDESPLNLMEGFKGPNHQEALLGEKIDGMVEWLKRYPEKLRALLTCAKTVFITYCGTLQTIMNKPYERHEGHTIYVERYQNIVFLSEDKRRNNSRENESEYMGEKMEHLVLSTNPNSNVRPDPSELVPSSREFCPIFEIELGNSVLIYGAQLDGILRTELVRGNKEEVIEILNNSTLIELKTTETLTEGKTMKMYRQATLSKCEQIRVVYKNGRSIKGRADRKEIIKTSDLSRNQNWNEERMVRSLLEQTIFIDSRSKRKADLSYTYRFTWHPRNKYKSYSYDLIPRERDTYKLLPDDFRSFVIDTGRALGSATALSWRQPRQVVAQKRRFVDEGRRWNDENVWGRGNQRRRAEFGSFNTRNTKSRSPSEEYRRFGGSCNTRFWSSLQWEQQPWRPKNYGRSPQPNNCNRLAESPCEPEKPLRYICSPRDYNPGAWSNEPRTTPKFQKSTVPFPQRRVRRSGNNRVARSCEQTTEAQKSNDDRPPVNNAPRSQYWFRRAPQESENKNPDRGVNQDHRRRGHV